MPIHYFEPPLKIQTHARLLLPKHIYKSIATQFNSYMMTANVQQLAYLFIFICHKNIKKTIRVLYSAAFILYYNIHMLKAGNKCMPLKATYASCKQQ